jgi:glycine cleavage system H protein
VVAKESAVGVIKNCILPDHLLYDVDADIWAEVQDDGSVRFGRSDVGQTFAGKMHVISFPRTPIGSMVARSRSLALLETSKWVGAIRAPVPGELMAINTTLLEHPLWVNLEPYGRGWVVQYRPSEPIPWLTGQEAQDAYAQRLKRTFRSVAGINDDFWCVHCNDWDEL